MGVLNSYIEMATNQWLLVSVLIPIAVTQSVYYVTGDSNTDDDQTKI